MNVSYLLYRRDPRTTLRKPRWKQQVAFADLCLWLSIDCQKLPLFTRPHSNREKATSYCLLRFLTRSQRNSRTYFAYCDFGFGSHNSAPRSRFGTIFGQECGYKSPGDLQNCQSRQIIIDRAVSMSPQRNTRGQNREKLRNNADN